MAFSITTAPLYGQGGSYTARADRLHLQSLTRFGGVNNATNTSTGTSTGDLAVTTTGTGNGSVNVAAGHIWMVGASGYGAYYAYNDSSSVVGPLSANSSGNPRIDVVVVRVTDNGSSSPTVAFAVLTGTPAVSPVAPSLTVSSTTVEVALAQISVPNGFTTSTTIVAANITDRRFKHALPNLAVPATTSTFVPTPVLGDLAWSNTNGRWEDYSGTAWQPFHAACICTSATRPTGTALYAGLVIYETDTNRYYGYTGSAWLCLHAAGTYTPTLTGMVVGTGGSAFNSAAWTFHFGHLYVNGRATFGTTGTTFPTAPTFTYPTGFTAESTIQTASNTLGTCLLTVGTSVNYAATVFYNNTTTWRILTHRYNPTLAAINYVDFTGLTTAIPGNWTAGDVIAYQLNVYGTLT